MFPRIKPLSCPSRRRKSSPREWLGFRDGGYALLILMMAVTVLLVALTAAMPNIYTEGRREREEELIFRGRQYQRAVALFRRQFNRFPSSVDELRRTNGIRFLRQAYPDPMTKSGKWRFIHVAPNGALLDSRTLGPGRQPSGGPAGNAGVGQNSQPTNAGQLGTNQPEQGTGPTSAFFGTSQSMPGALIAGVASTSSHESVRVLNSKKHYDDWEFLGVGSDVAGPQMVFPGQPNPSGQPGVLGQPQQPASPGFMSPPSSPPASPQ